MYTNCITASSRAADSLGYFQSLQDASTASPIHCSTTPHHYQYDSVSQLNSDHQVSCSAANYNSCSSGCTSNMGSPSSLTSYETQRVSSRFMQRSISSHSLQKNDGPHHHHHHPFSSLFAELLDLENGPVRRVYSTGDLQGLNGMQHYHKSDSPLSIESSMIIEGMSRTGPYSPEEKKVRIERYRSKRNQRNFNKKIKYDCRKTLADRRPRIRGRFAKNDEIVMKSPVQWSNNNSTGGEEEDDQEDENWDNFFDSLVSTNLAAQDQPQHSSSFGVFY